MSAAYLALKKLTGVGIVLTAARHNLREIDAELGPLGHIDGRRSHLNIVLSGPTDATAVAQMAECTMRGAGIAKLRKDAVRAIELVASLPPEASVDCEAFFSDALAWVRGFFSAPVLSAVVHMDESAPHAHVLLLPLLNGRMVGSDLVGNRSRLQAMQSDFYAVVASRHGLSRPTMSRRPSAAERRKAAEVVVECLRTAAKRLDEPNVRVALVSALSADPAPLMLALGLVMPATKAKQKRTFAEIWAMPAKPEPKPKPIGFKQGEEHNPIGFARSPHT